MKELLDSLVKQLGINEKQAAGGAGVLLKAAREKLGAAQFDAMLGKINGVNELLQRAPDSSGAGKLFGGLASALGGGGNAALIANVLSGFGKLGLNQEHAKQFVPVMLEFLRGKVGAGVIDQLEKALRA